MCLETNCVFIVLMKLSSKYTHESLRTNLFLFLHSSGIIEAGHSYRRHFVFAVLNSNRQKKYFLLWFIEEVCKVVQVTTDHLLTLMQMIDRNVTKFAIFCRIHPAVEL